MGLLSIAKRYFFFANGDETRVFDRRRVVSDLAGLIGGHIIFVDISESILIREIEAHVVVEPTVLYDVASTEACVFLRMVEGYRLVGFQIDIHHCAEAPVHVFERREDDAAVVGAERDLAPCVAVCRRVIADLGVFERFEVKDMQFVASLLVLSHTPHISQERLVLVEAIFVDIGHVGDSLIYRRVGETAAIDVEPLFVVLVAHPVDASVGRVVVGRPHIAFGRVERDGLLAVKGRCLSVSLYVLIPAVLACSHSLEEEFGSIVGEGKAPTVVGESIEERSDVELAPLEGECVGSDRIGIGCSRRLRLGCRCQCQQTKATQKVFDVHKLMIYLLIRCCNQ